MGYCFSTKKLEADVFFRCLSRRRRYGSIYVGVVDFIFRTCELSAQDCFLDIGSGIGPIVMQAAAWAGCRSLVRLTVTSRYDISHASAPKHLLCGNASMQLASRKHFPWATSMYLMRYNCTGLSWLRVYTRLGMWKVDRRGTPYSTLRHRTLELIAPTVQCCLVRSSGGSRSWLLSLLSLLVVARFFLVRCFFVNP